MRRDWDLVLRILEDMEQTPASQLARVRPDDYPDHDENTINEHLNLLIDAGLIEGKAVKSGAGPTRIATVFTETLTWEGHNFVENARVPGVWQRVQKTLSEKGGGASWEIVKGLVMAYAKERLGL